MVDFPTEGERVRLEWQEAQQNFALAEGSATRQGSMRDPAWAVLENPAPGSYQSGIRVISGWVCEAEEVVLEIDGIHRLGAAYGTEREDTLSQCGDTNNGFGLLWNWSKLADGPHTMRLLVDGEEWATATFTVTTLGEEFRRGLTHTAEVKDFPSPGEVVTVEWQEAQQNFIITGIRDWGLGDGNCRGNPLWLPGSADTHPGPSTSLRYALRLTQDRLRVNGTAAVRPERSPGGAKSKGGLPGSAGILPAPEQAGSLRSQRERGRPLTLSPLSTRQFCRDRESRGRASENPLSGGVITLLGGPPLPWRQFRSATGGQECGLPARKRPRWPRSQAAGGQG